MKCSLCKCELEESSIVELRCGHNLHGNCAYEIDKCPDCLRPISRIRDDSFSKSEIINLPKDPRLILVLTKTRELLEELDYPDSVKVSVDVEKGIYSLERT